MMQVRRTRLRWLAAPAAVMVVIMMAIVIHNYVHADQLDRGPRSHVTPAESAQAFADFPGLEDVTLRTSDELTLRGWFAPGSRRAAVIFTHGGGGNRMDLYAEARLIAHHGYGVLLYDSRASGESDGDLATRGDREQRDVEAALDFVSSRREVDPDRIALVGFSIGAASVAMVAASDVRARAVILCALWTSLEEELKKNLGKYGPLSWGPNLFALARDGVHIDNVRPIDRIAAISPRPILMIAGAHDGDTPLPVMRRVFAAAREPKELWVLDDAGHGGYFAAAPAEYESRVIGFLDRSLAEPVRTAR